MTGEADLIKLLAGRRPRLSNTEFAFGVVRHRAALPAAMVPLGTFRETEGTTVIIAAADRRCCVTQSEAELVPFP